MKKSRKTFWAIVLLISSLSAISAHGPRARATTSTISTNVLIHIIRAEDERRWDDNLTALLADKDARKRVALAAGRIGDQRALPALVDLLKQDSDVDVRQMAAFAIGEIESPAGADALLEVLGAVARPSGRAPDLNAPVRARAVEALGKIAAALPDSDKDRKRVYSEAILDALRFEAGRRSMPDRLTILLGLTATLRAKPDGAGPVVIKFLDYSDPRIVADALNTMARLRLKEGNERVRQLLNNGDAIVRANAARVIGAAEHKEAFDDLLARALNDPDLRVRVSAIRALGSLKDARAADPLLARGVLLINQSRTQREKKFVAPLVQNELLEIAVALGRVAPLLKDFAHQPRDKAFVMFFINSRLSVNRSAPEIEVGFARMAPQDYMTMHFHNPKFNHDDTSLVRWRRVSSLAQGLGELAALKPEKEPSRVNDIRSATEAHLAGWLCAFPEHNTRECRESIWLRTPEVLQAYAKFKSKNLSEVLKNYLEDRDVIIRSTAAELLGNQASDETNVHALVESLKTELPRTEKGEMNDAALAILEALAKQKSTAANDAIKTAMNSSDHLIRRKAVALLKANGAGDFSDRIGTVKTRNTVIDYRRAMARIGRTITATVITSKGAFTIEFLPEDAPLTVDNFIQLARKGFFNGQTIPRVVPNFVIQAGDPRGDTNGGPGYQIRCEINEVPYERGAVGMALSGKDTGGSQWFVTHSPQPHLDGGYTVFGHVTKGMDVVDNIARGDIIRRVVVHER